MNPAAYDAWYDTPRGRWIGDTEYTLIRHQLRAAPNATLLDVGCGTGWFTRRFALDGLAVSGLDPNSDWLNFAKSHAPPTIHWITGDVRHLPFADNSFDHTVSMTALCFVPEQDLAVREIVRVTRRRFAIGWLNRHSLLYRQKAGSGSYRGASWHSASEVRAFLDGLPIQNLRLTSAIFLPRGGLMAMLAEPLLPAALPWGALLLAVGEKA